MPHIIHHGGFPVGSVRYFPKVIKRRSAFIRYISAGNVIWLLKPDIQAHYAQLGRAGGDWRVGLPVPTPPRRRIQHRCRTVRDDCGRGSLLSPDPSFELEKCDDRPPH